MIIVEQAIFFISNFKIKCVSFFQKAKIVYLFCACVFCVFCRFAKKLDFSGLLKSQNLRVIFAFCPF